MNPLRKNLQVVQPNIEFTPENNGWPEDKPLTDPSSPLGLNVTVGRKGESMQKPVTTSQQRAGEHHKAEGNGSDQGTQPTEYVKSERAPSAFQTTGNVSDPGGDTDPVITQAPISEQSVGRANAYPTVTTQQHDKAHKLPEGY